MDESWKSTASAAMDRYARGDDAAFPELYDALAPRLSSFLQRRTGNTARAEELLQQTFLQMHCARRHFSEQASVVPWAFAIARRLLIDDFRKRREVLDDSERRDDRERAAPDASPDRLLGQRRLVRRMEDELARLPEAQRATFELVQRDGLSMEEAAAVLGTTVNAAKLRVSRAYQTLRAALGDAVREELDCPSAGTY
jgi:RNA polymerase sigma-70 factor (ECF subfamily)